MKKSKLPKINVDLAEKDRKERESKKKRKELHQATTLRTIKATSEYFYKSDTVTTTKKEPTEEKMKADLSQVTDQLGEVDLDEGDCSVLREEASDDIKEEDGEGMEDDQLSLAEKCSDTEVRTKLILHGCDSKCLDLTPYQNTRRCLGEFLCKQCDLRWQSGSSGANRSQRCPECGQEVFPHWQRPLDDWEMRSMSLRRHNGHPGHCAPGNWKKKADQGRKQRANKKTGRKMNIAR
eukprot:GFUD01137556.1.p1 GENE.GFUD01137556.1~~GFUD01137556.1.p1  ORF type:complete len:236 (-),score=69.51 GFUD01137556.1:51-758(-)